MPSAVEQDNGRQSTWRVPPEASERSLMTAVTEVVETGHRVFANRVEMALLQLRATLDESVYAAALLLVAVVFFATAWFALNAGMALALLAGFSTPVRLLAVAAANAVLAGAFVAAAARRRRRAQPGADSNGSDHVS